MMTPEQINAAVLGYAEQLDPAVAEKLGAPPLKANSNGEAHRHTAAAECPEESFRLTDYGNAERLVAQHRKDLRYCHDMKRWFCWVQPHGVVVAAGGDAVPVGAERHAGHRVRCGR